MSARVAWTAGTIAVGGIALVIFQTSQTAQDRQYGKTLKIYKDGKEKAQDMYKQAADKVSDTVNKK